MSGVFAVATPYEKGLTEQMIAKMCATLFGVNVHLVCRHRMKMKRSDKLTVDAVVTRSPRISAAAARPARTIARSYGRGPDWL
jgi:NaMN:DMB phosphoribosyltransferase